MPSIKNLEMAAAVSAYNNVTTKKSLFSTKYFYVPTMSRLRATVLEYAPAEGERLIDLLAQSADKLAERLAQEGKPQPAAIGHYRLEACLSDDRQFCVVQLFRFVDFKHSAVSAPRFCTGEEAGVVSKLF